MIVASSIIPGFGLFGSIVDFITSNSPNSGKRLVLEIISAAIPGNFLSNLGVNLATEFLLGSDIDYASQSVVPYNENPVICSHCKNPTYTYALIDGKLLCSMCIASSIKNNIRVDDNVYILKNGIYQLHNELKSKVLFEKQFQSQNLKGRIL